MGVEQHSPLVDAAKVVDALPEAIRNAATIPRAMAGPDWQTISTGAQAAVSAFNGMRHWKMPASIFKPMQLFPSTPDNQEGFIDRLGNAVEKRLENELGMAPPKSAAELPVEHDMPTTNFFPAGRAYVAALEEKKSIMSQLHAAKHDSSPAIAVPSVGSQIPVDKKAMSVFDPRAPLQPHVPNMQAVPMQRPANQPPSPQYYPQVPQQGRGVPQTVVNNVPYPQIPQQAYPTMPQGMPQPALSIPHIITTQSQSTRPHHGCSSGQDRHLVSPSDTLLDRPSVGQGRLAECFV